jgi:hypothetical protein
MTMKNVSELRDQLSQVFAELRSGAIKAKDASELANIAGKLINSAKVQIEYYALRKDKPSIPFLDALVNVSKK